jgi:hypothetical protein
MHNSNAATWLLPAEELEKVCAAREEPHFTHTTWLAVVVAPQVGQKFFSAKGGTPQLTQTTALSLISLPQFLQYMLEGL